MSERLTDEELDNLDRWYGWRGGVHARAVAELRERRAADAAKFDAAVAVMPGARGAVRRAFLTGRDVESLDALACAIRGSLAKSERVFADALAVLDRLLGGK